jgi:anti-sigma factor RsiW
MSSSGLYVCREFVEDVTDYLEGVLPDDVVARLEAHLANCPHCREYLHEMRRTIATTGALGADDVDAMPADLRERLLDAFREEDV